MIEAIRQPNQAGVYGAMDASATATLSLSPPPSFSRMPPDGHEFPPNYQEPCPDPITPSPNLETPLKMIPPPLPTTAPPPIAKKKPIVRTSLEIASEPITNAVRKFSTSSSVSSTDEVIVRPSTRSSTWRNDEKSERSVRDKIAMFSNVADESPISPSIAPRAMTLNRKLNRFKSSEDVFSQTDSVDCSSGSFPSGKLFSRSVLSVDKVASHTRNPESIQSPRKPMKKSLNYNSMMDVTQVTPSNHQNKPSLPNSLEFGSRTQSSMDLTSSSSSSSSSAYSSCSPDSSLTSTTSPPYMGYASTLPRKSARENERKSSLTSSTPPSLDNKPTLTRAMSFTGGNKLHSRSQSLVDVNAPLGNKYVPNSVIKGNSEEARRASLNALIEQRRRSISKLRGLVIPERVAEVTLPQPIIDLPEIKSRDSVISKMCPPVAEEPVRRLSVSSTSRVGTTSSSPVCANYINAVSAQNNLTSPPWKSQTPVSDLPKYSPAFKRKSLAVYGAPSSASSVSSSLSSSREELRPLFENNNSANVAKTMNNVPPAPPSKPPRTINRQSYSSQSTVLPLSPTLQHTEPPKSLESITSPTRSDMSFEFVSSSGSSPDVKMMKTGQAQFEDKNGISKSNNYKNGIHEPQVMPLIKLTGKHRMSTDVRRSGGEESDNDSAVSSSRSSISHDYSPPQSPLPDSNQRLVDEDSTLNRSHTLLSPSNSTSSGDRQTLRRTLSSETTASAASSTASTLTSGSQASCSSSSTDSMSRRVLKAQSVEAINRKNVLSSARFSSGQDLKVGSPLIQRKFDENSELSKNLNYSESSSVTVNTTEENTECFINKLNKTLQKEEHNDVEQSDDSIDKSVISYQLTTNKEYTINSTKVAYLEVEVMDGAFSSQEDSSFIDSNPSSMEHLDAESVPVPREVCPRQSENENIVLDVNLDNSDNSNDNKIEAKKDIYNEVLTGHYQTTTKSLSKLLDEEEIVVPKPMIKRLSRDHKNNCDITTPVVPDNTEKTASIEFLNNEKNSEGKEGVPEEKIIPEVPPKPTQRMVTSDFLPDSSKKEEFTEAETDTTKQQGNVNNRVKEQNISPTSKIPTASVRSISNRRSVSVNDIRKAFEKAEMSLGGSRVNKMGINGTAYQIPSHVRVSSLDSTTSEDSCAPTPTHYGSITNLQKEQQFGSITSLASSTSLISQQELQQLIDDANQTLEETGGCSHEVVVVILHRDTAGGSIGITLAGGADYESKEITVHKVLAGSPADRDGRIQKGDRILSINGRSMKGVSHRESLAILKAPRPEVVLVVSRWRPDGYTDSAAEDPLVLSLRNTLRPPRIPEQLPEIPSETPTNEKVPEETTESVSRGPPVTVTLVKDGAGLGFSLEGGKDSPFGDQPLTIKKIFTGGCAEKSGELFAGDELLSVNGTDVTTMSRIEAWGLMKRLADGKVVLSVRHKVANSGQ